MMMSKPLQPVMMMTKSHTPAPRKGEEHKKNLIEGVVENQAVEELVKKDLDEGGEDLRHKELQKSITEDDEEAVPHLGGTGAVMKGCSARSQGPYKNKET